MDHVGVENGYNDHWKYQNCQIPVGIQRLERLTGSYYIFIELVIVGRIKLLLYIGRGTL